MQQYRILAQRGPVAIWDVETALQIFQYAFNNLTNNPDSVNNNSDLELKVFKAVMAQNQKNIEPESKYVEILNRGNVDLETFPLIQFALSFRKSEFLNYNLNAIFICEMVKAVMVLEFLDRHETYGIYLHKLLEEFECKTWVEYFVRLTSLLKFGLERESSLSEIVIPKDSMFASNKTFLEKHIASFVDEEDDRDFISIRDKPFYEAESGNYRIIFDRFVAEKMYRGLFFKIWDIHKVMAPEERPVKNFKSFWGKEISEEYLSFSILNSIYGKYIAKTGADLDKAMDGAPDYYVRNGKRIFLFEIKDVLIRADDKRSNDFGRIDEALREKFFFSRESEKNQAVLQLAQSIRTILTGNAVYDPAIPINKVEIFPILLTHDRLFDTPGFNKYINRLFKEELTKLMQEGLDVSRVREITVINIDTLMIYQDHLRERKIKLHEVIDAYIKITNFDTKKKYSLPDAMSKLRSTSLPFSVFIEEFRKESKFVNKEVFRIMQIVKNNAVKLTDEEAI